MFNPFNQLTFLTLYISRILPTKINANICKVLITMSKTYASYNAYKTEYTSLNKREGFGQNFIL